MSNLATITNNILADSGIDDINVIVSTGSYTNPSWIVSLPWTKITGTPTTLSGYGITDAYTQTQVNNLLAGYLPLTGGALTGPITSSSSAVFKYSDSFSLKVDSASATQENDLRFAKGGVDFGAIQTNGTTGDFELYVNVDGTSGGWNESIILKRDATRIDFLISNSINTTINSSGLTSVAFIKTGGTASQFLKADGTVDSNTYLTTSAAASTYLPLTGGTLTGDLTITRAAIAASSVNANNSDGYSYFSNQEGGTLRTYFLYLNSLWSDVDRRNNLEIRNQNGPITFWANAAKALTIANSGASTFTSSVTVTNSISLSNSNVAPTGGGIYQGINLIQIVSGSDGFTVNNANNLVVNFRVANTGATTITNLAGTGTRMVVADANGLLSTQAIGSGSVTGSGTLNKVAKFTATGSVIGDSIITATSDAVTITSSLVGPMFVLEQATANAYSQMRFFGDTQSAYIFKGNSSYTSYGGTNALNFYTDGGSGSGGFAFHPSNIQNAVFIDPAGNLGIGVGTTVNAKLDIAGTINAGNSANTSTADSLLLHGKGALSGGIPYGDYGSIVLNADSSYTSGARRFLITNAFNATRFAIIQSVDSDTTPTLGAAGAVTSGNLIFSVSNTGTAEFSVPLIGTSATFSSSVTSGDILYVGAGGGGGGYWTWGGSDSYILAPTGKNLHLYSGDVGTNGLKIATTGAATFSSSVGIGRAPATPFDVYAGTSGALALMQNTQSNGYSGIDIFRQDGTHGGSLWCANDTAPSTNNRNAITLAARTTGEKVIIVGGGYDPTVTGGFTVQNSNTKIQGSDAHQQIYSTSGSYTYLWLNTAIGAGRNTYLVQNNPTSTTNGVAAGSSYLYFAETQQFEFVWAGISKVQITSAGNITATAFFESSDSRLKSNIINLDVDASVILAKHYTKDGVEEIGYIAQDVEKILPSAISKKHDGYLNLSYRQVHTAKIAYLEKRITELEQQLKQK